MKQIAAAIEVPLTTYREWELGRSVKDLYLMKLARFYDISIETLTGDQKVLTIEKDLVERRCFRLEND